MWKMYGNAGSKLETFDLDDANFYILEYFVQGSSYSAWDMTEGLEGTRHEMHYVNVLKRLHILASNGLIKLLDCHFPRSAKHYKLTPEGLFCILSSPFHYFLPMSGHQFFRNYGDDDIFSIFLYPSISIETITKLNNIAIHSTCLDYLTKCCRTIRSLLKGMIDENSGYDTEVAVDVISANRHEGHLFSLYKLLFFKLNLPFHLSPKIEKRSGNELRVTYEGYEIIVKLYQEERLVRISVVDILGKICMYQCSPDTLGFDIQKIGDSRKYGHWLEEKLNYETSELRNRLVEQLFRGYDYLEEHNVPMSILANDTNFAKALERSWTLLTKKYNKIMNVRINSSC